MVRFTARLRRAGLTYTAFLITVALTPCVSGVQSMAADELVGRAVLPATTFARGPIAGTLLGSEPINGQQVPFRKGQPVQGFSAVLDNGDGTFLAMSDNGFGSLEN
ncbi:MAG: esterase-like activity of phytase family protein, partial [Candidatus Binatia bacterium]